MLRINPETGDVNSRIDLSEINEQAGSQDVLNGIAYNAVTDQVFVTGKNWTELYEIKVDESKLLSASDQAIYLKDFNVKEDTITLAGFGYESQEDITAHLTATSDGAVRVSDQGTEVKIAGLGLDEAFDMALPVLKFTTLEGELGAIQKGEAT